MLHAAMRACTISLYIRFGNVGEDNVVRTVSMEQGIERVIGVLSGK